jgi:hypothetical protein
LEPNFKNPLPFEMRKQMIEEWFSKYFSKSMTVIPIVDVFNVGLWSKNLDEKIKELTSETDVVTLYGSRDSFIFNYVGKYPTIEVKSFSNISASQLREEVKRLDVTVTAEEFRKGVIWSLRNEA